MIVNKLIQLENIWRQRDFLAEIKTEVYKKIFVDAYIYFAISKY